MRKNNGTPRARSSTTFDACRISAPIQPAWRRRLFKLATTTVSACGLRVIPLLEDDWGGPKQILLFEPRIRRFTCNAVRYIWGVASDKSGRIFDRFGKDQGEFLRKCWWFSVAVLSDYSLSSNWCVRDERGERLCYPKKQILRFVNLTIPCIEENTAHLMPKNEDAGIYCLAAMFKVAENAGIIKYMGR